MAVHRLLLPAAVTPQTLLSWVIALCVAAVLGLHWGLIYVAPSPLAGFIQRSTVTIPRVEFDDQSAAGINITEAAQNRITAKQRVVFPALLLFDYPLSFAICASPEEGGWLGSAYAFGGTISSNVISITHPLVAFLACYCFIRAARNIAAKGTPTPASPSTRAPTYLTNKPGSTADVSELDLEGGDLQGDEEGGRRQEGGLDATWMRLGAALVITRNVMDAMDGVTARLRMRHEMPLPPIFGMSGALFDVVTDAIGCTSVCLSLLASLYQTDIRTRSLVVQRFCRRIGFLDDSKSLHFVGGRILAFGCMAVAAVTTSVWEFFMVRLVTCFDKKIFSSVQAASVLLPIDRSYWLNSMMFGWSWLSGDAFFCLLMAVVAICPHRLWSALQIIGAFGYFFLALHTMYSMWLWFAWVMPTITSQLGTDFC